VCSSDLGPAAVARCAAALRAAVCVGAGGGLSAADSEGGEMTRVNRVMASRAARVGLWLCLSFVAAGSSAEELTAAQVVERAHAAAGGQAWLAAGTNVMRGHATLCRDGNPARCVESDRYEMYRVYPTKLEHGAHAGSGKFRLDAYAGDRVLFKVA